jgi:putative ABC transport system substrate-binding protein
MLIMELLALRQVNQASNIKSKPKPGTGGPMSKSVAGGLLFVFALSLWLVLAMTQAVSAQGPKRVFILHSYEKGHVCGQPQYDGVIEGLKRAGFVEGRNLTVDTYYMDTKKKNNTPELIAKQALIAQKKVRQFSPDLLITLDDNAFSSVALPLAGTSQKIVFSGMNGQPEEYNRIKKFMNSRERPGYNITGVYEKLHVREAIQVMSKLLPFKKVLILTDTSPTGRAVAKQVSLELESADNYKNLTCSHEIKVMKSWEDFKKQIARINYSPQVGAFYLGTLLLKSNKGKTFTAPEIISWTIANARKPAIGPNYAFIKLGLIGGATVDFHAMGLLAGKMAGAILNGKSPGVIPIEEAQRVALVFNVKRAKQLGIEIPKDILLAADEVFTD